MSKDVLNDLVRSNATDVNRKSTNVVKDIQAVVMNVDEDYSYATVKLVGNNETVITLVNKTGEKLSIGDGVRVYYNTDISCGWIGMRNGKPEPIGGGNLTIDSAAVIPTSAEKSYLKDAEVFNIDVKNHIKVAYGNPRNRIIVDGYLCPVNFNMPNMSIHSCVEQFIFPTDVWEDFRKSQIASGDAWWSKTFFYDLTDEQKKFFEDNIDCVVSELPGGKIANVATTTNIGDVSYVTRTYNDITYGHLICNVRYQTSNGASSYSHSPDVPKTFGILPVVHSLGTQVLVKKYIVAYDINGTIMNVYSPSPDTEGGAWRYSPSTSTVTLTDAEYKYAFNIQSRSELKPSDNND